MVVLLSVRAPVLAHGDVAQAVESLAGDNAGHGGPELRFGFPQAAGVEVEFTELVPSAHTQGRQCHGGVQLKLCLRIFFPGSLVQAPEVQMRVGVIRARPHGPLKIVDRFVVMSLPCGGEPKVIEQRSAVRRDDQRPLPLALSRVRLHPIPVYRAQVHAQALRFRHRRQRHLVIRRVIPPIAVARHNADESQQARARPERLQSAATPEACGRGRAASTPPQSPRPRPSRNLPMAGKGIAP